STLYASTRPKLTSPTPATRSTTRRNRSPAARPTSAVPDASDTSHVRLPRPTPAISSTALGTEPAAPAALAAEKIAAQDAIVSGFDAVAERAVRNPRRGLMGSAPSPRWIRNALQSVLAPSKTSTVAPRSPRITSRCPIASSGAAPAAPSAAYARSMTAIPAAPASPPSQPFRSVERIRYSDSGPSWSATKNPSPKPTVNACTRVHDPPVPAQRRSNGAHHVASADLSRPVRRRVPGPRTEPPQHGVPDLRRDPDPAPDCVSHRPRRRPVGAPYVDRRLRRRRGRLGPRSPDARLPREVPALVVRLEPRAGPVREPRRRLPRPDGRPLPVDRRAAERPPGHAVSRREERPEPLASARQVDP